jgi:hypothetical protein
MLAGLVLVALGVGVLCAENACLLAVAYPNASLVAAWMSVGLLLMSCGAVLIGLAHVNDRLEPRSDAIPIGPSATGPDAPQLKLEKIP